MTPTARAATRCLLVAALLVVVACVVACQATDDDSSAGSGGDGAAAMSSGGSTASGSAESASSGGVMSAASGGKSGAAGTGGTSMSANSGGSGALPADAGTHSDAGAMPSDAGMLGTGGAPAQQPGLPDGVVAVFPRMDGVCADPPLRITFEAPPTLGNGGKIRVFDSAQPGSAVATVDMAQASVTNMVDGTAYKMSRRVYVDGNAAVVYLPAHALSYGHEYYVNVESGAIAGPGGAAFAISDATTWQFSVAAAAPATSSAIDVALDGRGEFCSVQGAIDAIPANNSTALKISIAAGTYHEIIYWKSKNNITIHGADRKATRIVGINNEKLNGGTAMRALIGIDASHDIAIENLTIQNLTPQDGSQAEALRMQTCDKCTVRDADILSLQDTLLWSGRIYASHCYIAGNVDFIWGTGAAYFDQCEIKTLGRKGYNVQARNSAGGYGYVFVDSKLTSDPGVTGNVLARVDVSAYPASHVAYIDCELGSHIAPSGWLISGGAASSALRFWEYQSKNSSGELVDTSQRQYGKQITSAQAAMMRDASVVLGGWQPDQRP
jgi:pectin methylesterase-like acyl-CoA thioesterase